MRQNSSVFGTSTIGSMAGTSNAGVTGPRATVRWRTNGFACCDFHPVASARSVSSVTSFKSAGGVGPESARTRAIPGSGKKLQPVNDNGVTIVEIPSSRFLNGSGSCGPTNTRVRCHSEGSTTRHPGGRVTEFAVRKTASETSGGTGKQVKRLPITAAQYTIATVRHQRSVRLSGALLLAALLLPFLPSPTWAAGFDRAFVLDDRDVDLVLAPGSSLTRAAIARFLSGTGGAIGQMVFSDRGLDRTVAEIIESAAIENRITAQFLLAMLEKEQGLITDPSPSQHQLDYAMGYGCPSSCDPARAGFAKQVRAAAAQHRAYLDDLAQGNQTVSGWGVGVPKITLDGLVVTPSNRATAAAYTYNPYVGVYGDGDPRYGGVSLLWRIFERWFVARYPDGSLLRQRGSPGVWLIENGTRRAFLTKAALLAGHDPAKVIEVPPTVLVLYPIGEPIAAPVVGLVRIETGGVYLLDGRQKRPIPSLAIFRQIGFNPDEVFPARSSEIASIPTGPPVTLDDEFPTGKLFQIIETGGILNVQDGMQHAIVDRTIWKTRFGGVRPTRVALSELARYPIGDPVGFRDGELVRSNSDGSIYVISNGLKRKIPDLVTFRRLGYRWSNVIRTTDRALAVHPAGETLEAVSFLP